MEQQSGQFMRTGKRGDTLREMVERSIVIDFETTGLRDDAIPIEVTLFSAPGGVWQTVRFPLPHTGPHWPWVGALICEPGAWRLHAESGVFDTAMFCEPAEAPRLDLVARAAVESFIATHALEIRELPALCGYSPHFDLARLARLRRTRMDGFLSDMVSHRLIDIGALARALDIEPAKGDHTSINDVRAVLASAKAVADVLDRL